MLVSTPIVASFLTELKGRSGIYQIRNILNGKVYVGSAANLYKRKGEHWGDLKRNKHCSPKLQNSYNKHGVSAFVFEVLEFTECDRVQLLKREEFWIAELKATGRETGYNTRSIPNSCLGVAKSEECKARIAASLRGRKRPPEVGQLISAIKRANPRRKTQEERDRFSAKMKGRKPSEATMEGGKRFRLENPNYRMKLFGKPYSFTSPNGEVFSGVGIEKFAKSQGLCARAMWNVYNEKVRSHRRWTKTGGKDSGRIKFRVFDPNGVIHEGENLKKFSEDHGLDYETMREMVVGKGKSCKNWTLDGKKESLRFAKRKPYAFLSPSNELVTGVNLSEFCRQYDLDIRNVSAVYTGKRKHYKGWRLPD